METARRFSKDGTWDLIVQALLVACWSRPTRPGRSMGRSRWIPRSAGCTSTPARCTGRTLRCFPAAQGNSANDSRQPPVEPVDHAIGRSRGRLTTTLHTLVDGNGRPLVIEAGPVRVGGDSPMLPMLAVLLDRLRVPRNAGGRPRTRPDALLADKAYSSRGHCEMLRDRGITAVIPARADQAKHRARRGSQGGRQVSYDTEAYQGRNVVERSYNHFQAMARPSHPLPQTRRHLPRCRGPPQHHHLARHGLGDTA